MAGDEFGRPRRAALEELPARRVTDVPDLGIVPPDKAPVQVETNDKTITHKICHAELVVSQAAIDKARNENGRLYCPTCRAEFDLDTWSV